MVKKFQKTRKKTKGFRLFFPIKIASAIVFSITMIVILLIAAAINIKVVSSLRHDLTSFFISNLSSFKEAQATENYTELSKKLNYELGDSYLVRYIVITDNNQSEIFSTFSPEKPYKFIQNQNSSTFMLDKNGNFDFIVDKIENIKIKMNDKNYYIGILQSENINNFI